MANHFLQLSIKEDSSLSGFTITMSPSLLHYWGINENKKVFIQIGITTVTVVVQEHRHEKQTVFFSKDVMEQLKLPEQNLYFLAQFFRQTETIFLGPIVAILTEIKENNDITPDFRSLRQLCEELKNEISDIGGLIYVCGLQDFYTDSITGYSYQHNKWEKTTLPYPTVVYNRLHSRKLDASVHFQHLKKSLGEKAIPLFNSQFFSKYDTHLLLEKDARIQKHLPETKRLSKEAVEMMVKSYTSIYIKPVHGSQGRNIIHLTTIDNKYCATASSGKQKGKKHFFFSTEELWKWIQRFTKDKIYLIQEGIDFQPFQRRSLDFRVLCHKNYDNHWKATSIVARAANNDAFVANLAQGAELLQAKTVLPLLFGKEHAQALLIELKKLAADVAEIISENTDGYLGEMGIDIGVDTNGALWIIEANSKPSKSLDEPSTKVRPSTKALLEYFIRLSFPN
ncbi:YheC/YheD family endospore coat-associated protein [Niallia sp. 01092]|uniref:YheC/YheD family endospore coat-associated protein n=1 Tax=unclassified Niallia TaxID=2837522 RepID=UPI003FD5169A